ncbi:hypothetical protein DXG01_010354 [Tephrocybe rancida]|nr:hypothetical protein DXG01_010354 [Tephrocybe rancida]
MQQSDDYVTRGVIRISSDSEPVTDADEEIFLLYSGLLAGEKSDTDTFRGLGHVDSRKDIIMITFELKAPSQPSTTDSKVTRSQRARKSQKPAKVTDKTVQVELHQDKTALRSRKGDTGSVVWKASTDFAQVILQQLHAQAPDALFDVQMLKSMHVLELGAGTGLLAVALAPHVGHYTVTDIEALQPLLCKNIAANFPGWTGLRTSLAPGHNVFVQELDWVALSNTAPAQRRRLVDIESPDLVLVVDCIYHPSLLPSLVETINYIAVPGRTSVLVVVELRAEDVIREFLSLWLSRPGWEILRVGGLLPGPYAAWVGWQALSTEDSSKS